MRWRDGGIESGKRGAITYNVVLPTPFIPAKMADLPPELSYRNAIGSYSRIILLSKFVIHSYNKSLAFYLY